MHPRMVARGASERHRGEKVRRSAVDGAFIVVVWYYAGCDISRYARSNRYPVTWASTSVSCSFPIKRGAFAAAGARRQGGHKREWDLVVGRERGVADQPTSPPCFPFARDSPVSPFNSPRHHFLHTSLHFTKPAFRPLQPTALLRYSQTLSSQGHDISTSASTHFSKRPPDSRQPHWDLH
jgi:hypothetical protein